MVVGYGIRWEGKNIPTYQIIGGRVTKIALKKKNKITMILFPPPLYINYVPPKRSFHGKSFSKYTRFSKWWIVSRQRNANDSTGPRKLQKLLKLPESWKFARTSTKYRGCEELLNRLLGIFIFRKRLHVKPELPSGNLDKRLEWLRSQIRYVLHCLPHHIVFLPWSPTWHLFSFS